MSGLFFGYDGDVNDKVPVIAAAAYRAGDETVLYFIGISTILDSIIGGRLTASTGTTNLAVSNLFVIVCCVFWSFHRHVYLCSFRTVLLALYRIIALALVAGNHRLLLSSRRLRCRFNRYDIEEIVTYCHQYAILTERHHRSGRSPAAFALEEDFNNLFADIVAAN